MGFKSRIKLTSRRTRKKSSITSLGNGLVLYPIWKPRSLRPSESQRATRTKDSGSTGEGYQQLMCVDKAMAVEGKAVVGVAGAEAEDTGTPMAHSSM